MDQSAAPTRPKPEMVNGFSDEDLSRQPERARHQIERRAALLGPGYQLFYSDPVDVVRGHGVHLFDADGNDYLDAYNNVVSVGHCHPAVVEAVSRQTAVLNTNTRYLQESLLDYSADLLSTFPDDLDRVTYTCTGSEANDLALRIARFHTGNQGLVVTENAYHGVTAAVADISPSLGKTSPLGPHVRTICAPDAARLGADGLKELMRHQMRTATADLERHGYSLCAVIVDSIFSSDGVFAHPATVLTVLADEAHRAGGLFIADEVQPGFGRTGEGWWGFARHGVVPDIVTIGKPMGNGIPVAATVLRREVGQAFGEKVRYFNTFGGSSVPIAAAQAVLDVIRSDQLIAHAHSVGTYLLDELRALTAPWPQIAEVRGTGLFIGIEVVSDPIMKTPGGALAQAIVDDLRHHFVLVSASGPAGNVIKVRPPLVFTKHDAARLLDQLAGALTRCLRR